MCTTLTNDSTTEVVSEKFDHIFRVTYESIAYLRPTTHTTPCDDLDPTAAFSASSHPVTRI